MDTKDQLAEGLYALGQMYDHEHRLAVRYRWLRNHWASAGEEFWDSARDIGLDGAVDTAMDRERRKASPPAAGDGLTKEK
jgi:hypothetical protein